MQKKSPQQISEELRQLVREELATIFSATAGGSGQNPGQSPSQGSSSPGSSLAQQEKEILARLADNLSQLRTVLSQTQTLADQMDQLLQSHSGRWKGSS